MGPVADGPINRTLRLLVALCEGGPQTLSALAAETGLSPPTVLRFLRLMRDEGFAVQDENREWRATLLVFRLGCAVVDRDGWGTAVDRVLRQLAADLGETAVYAVYDEGWATYVAQAEPTRTVRTHIPIGSRWPTPDVLTGRCMLACLPVEERERAIALHWSARRRKGPDGERLRRELDEIARVGYAAGEGEVWHGLWGAAVPVLGRFGELVGAIGISVPGERRSRDTTQLIEALCAAGRTLGAERGVVAPDELDGSS
jgi:DNA-binding IclR family transcriptional regulator